MTPRAKNAPVATVITDFSTFDFIAKRPPLLRQFSLLDLVVISITDDNSIERIPITI